ncbi:acetylxylan esterase [Ornithinimicrobium sp. CNJ-824]|uniref:acetylxylan esterase n=1 Tax=Ornithinimicrobium sp. CNJ-824 TaxID=1904966 RepID=UPI00095A3D24|nr:acetylxylan esterase [Ornithinimicrobium sp. CNJ-824]OLT20553.1 acetylxylan esterase [Ornithinimicrobium sp. CNJ-824]
MHTDLPLEQLRTYRPEVPEPEDFDEFWAVTLAQARAAGGEAEEEVTCVPADTPVTALRVEDVTFPGFDGEPVLAWFVAPPSDGPLPCVVEFLGYGGGRGLPQERLAWAAAGYAHLVMDTRGQGSTWGSGGGTPDPHGSGPAYPGVMTRGISSPHDYYYRRLVTDAVRAVDHVLTRDDVDPDRVAVVGTSQGGGMALAVGALHDRVAAVVADVPFLCHLERAVTITDAAPYAEITAYLAVHRGMREQVFRTLSYVDGVVMARRITAPTMVSVALMDQTCPPSTVFAAANAIPEPPTVEVYPFNDHEGGAQEQWVRSVRWLGEVLADRGGRR